MSNDSRPHNERAAVARRIRTQLDELSTAPRDDSGEIASAHVMFGVVVAALTLAVVGVSNAGLVWASSLAPGAGLGAYVAVRWVRTRHDND